MSDLMPLVWLHWLLEKAGKDELKALDMLAGMAVAFSGQLFKVGYSTDKAQERFVEVEDECELWLSGHDGEWGPMEWILAASCLLAASHQRFQAGKERAEARVQ